MSRTVVHLLRHGEVHNPGGVLYGRSPGFHLSALGRRMAERVADQVGDRDIVHVAASPLERAQETAAPLATALGLPIGSDPRLIESWNVFAGETFSQGGLLRSPKAWKHLRNPFRPSWGEPYREIATRMLAAIESARVVAEGHEAVLVSHQLPIWTTRLHLEGRRYLHDPRRRQCTLCSLTSLEYEDATLLRITYSEPAGDLVPVQARRDAFSAGGTEEAPPALAAPAEDDPGYAADHGGNPDPAHDPAHATAHDTEEEGGR
ncbi:histidine phosphatase family protein [Nocardioides sp. GY 10127]|nr:histidine phosphatase family protein [Nocardioides sp. GY 10127]